MHFHDLQLLCQLDLIKNITITLRYDLLLPVTVYWMAGGYGVINHLHSHFL